MKHTGKYVIGITGGVGTGKSFVSGYIGGRYNATVIFADEIAKLSYEKDGACDDKIVETFGEDILDRNKDIDRPYLARLVFADPEKRAALNAIIHPYVARYVESKIAATDGLIVYEAALPKEARRGVRMKRLTENRGYTKDRCEKMLAAQLPDAEFKALANVVIENNDDLFATVDRVDKQMTRILIENGGVIS